MNVFNSLGFGKLIKTLLPGLLIFISLLLFIDSVFFVFKININILNIISTNQIISGLLTLPFSIICGIFSNIIYFTYFNDLLIRNHFNNNNPEFVELEKSIKQIIITKKIKYLQPIRSDFVELLEKQIDIDYLLMPQIQLDKLIFLQESYWYYMEFQSNILLSLFPLLIAMIVRCIIFFPLTILQSRTFWAALALFLIIIIAISYILLVSARLNFQRHKIKLLSYYLALHIEKTYEKPTKN